MTGQFEVARESVPAEMSRPIAQPVVHLELQTHNLPQACAFYTRLFGWQAETIRTASGSYLWLELGEGVRGGVVERECVPSAWLPYVEVPDIVATTERGRLLGAKVILTLVKDPPGGAVSSPCPRAPRSPYGSPRTKRQEQRSEQPHSDRARDARWCDGHPAAPTRTPATGSRTAAGRLLTTMT